MKLIVNGKELGEVANYEYINRKHHFDMETGLFAEVEYPNEIVSTFDESEEYDAYIITLDWDKVDGEDDDDEEDYFDDDFDDLEIGFNPYMGCYDYDC